jgi:CRISPR-associated endonuclease Cas2
MPPLPKATQERVHGVESEVHRGVRTVTGMPLRSRQFGVSGIADVVELRRGPNGGRPPYPVEHKRGRPKAHRADELQLCAQAIALEEVFDTEIAEGALFYGQPRRRSVIAFDSALGALCKSRHRGEPRRLRRFARACQDYRQRVQFSIFEIQVAPEQWVLPRAGLLSEIDASRDSLRFYFLGSGARRRIEHVGVKPALDFDAPLIV